MNLATARSAKRAAEVGIRKVLGAEKTQLIRQFLGEAILLSLLAFVLAFAMLQLLLPFFSTVTNTDLALNFSRHGLLIGGFVLLAIITGLVAGFYPAFYLSAFRPIKVLKGRFSNSLSAVTLRKSLVVLQFAISAVLIIACFVIGRQTNYMRNMDLGFAKDQQIVIPLRSQAARDMYTSLKSELRSNTAIESIGGSAYYPGIFNASDLTFFAPGKTVEDGVNIKLNYVDKTMLQTLAIKPVAGRLFTDEFPADTNQRLVLNETAVRKLGFPSPQAAVGQRLTFPWQDTTYMFEVVGVVHDFNFEGLKQAIQPFGFRTRNSNFNYLIIHSRSGNPESLLSSLETTWKKLNPNEQFEYSFLDEDFQKNHESEQRLFMLIRYFMIIAIVISCLGLLGLVIFSAEQRTREIGIRKVLGSSVTGIVGLLSKEFLMLVLIGNMIALPLAWYILNKWMQEFAYRADLSWWLFGVAVVVSLAIAMITLSFQAIKAGLANPVRSLRSE
jgi:putative ABC transport system permease protein